MVPLAKQALHAWGCVFVGGGEWVEGKEDCDTHTSNVGVPSWRMTTTPATQQAWSAPCDEAVNRDLPLLAEAPGPGKRMRTHTNAKKVFCNLCSKGSKGTSDNKVAADCRTSLALEGP